MGQVNVLILLCGAGLRRRVAALTGLLTALVLGLSVATVSSAAADGPVTLSISPTTSPLSIYSGNIDLPGPGDSYPLANVSVSLSDCPAGEYQRRYSLSQDGYEALWDVGGMGAGEWRCTGEPQQMDMTFLNPEHPLHPGAATATVTLLDSHGEVVVASATQTVTIPASAPTAPLEATGGMSSTSSATLSWTPPFLPGGTITGYRVSRDGGTAGAGGWATTVSAATRSLVFNNLVLGRSYTLSVAAVNASGTGDAAPVTVVPGTPGLPTKVAARSTTASSLALSWTPPVTAGAAAVTGYRVTRDTGAWGDANPWSAVVSASTRSYTFNKLTTGDTFLFTVAAINAKGTGSAVTVKRNVPGSSPGTPVIGTAVAGTSGGAVTATATWSYPGWTHFGAVTGFVVRASRISAGGGVLGTTTSAVQPVSATSLSMSLPQTGNYRFTVQAVNDLGAGPQSAQSNLVTGR